MDEKKKRILNDAAKTVNMMRLWGPITSCCRATATEMFYSVSLSTRSQVSFRDAELECGMQQDWLMRLGI